MKRREIIRALGTAAAVCAPGLASAAVSANELKVGQSSLLSGPVGPYMKTRNAGSQLCFDRVNAEGGIRGKRLSLLALDDGLDAARAVKNYDQLINQHQVVAMLTCVGSATTLAAAPLLRASRVPMVGGMAVADSVRTATADVAYYVRAGYGREVDALVGHLATVSIGRVALGYLDNPGGEEVLVAFRNALRRHGGQETGVGALKVDGSNATAVGKMLGEAKPQAVIIFCPGPAPTAVMEGVWSSGARPTFYGLSVVSGELAFKQLGPRARGLTIVQVVPYPWERTNNFLHDYRRLAGAAGQEPGYTGLEGYINAMVLVAALKNTGRDPSRAQLHTALKKVKMRFASMEVDFTESDPAASKFVELVQIAADGRFVR